VNDSGAGLAAFTTLRVGGPAGLLIEPATEPELMNAALEVWADEGDWLVLGGGSNVVVSDEGFAGTVIRIVTRGIARIGAPIGRIRLRVQAGEPWDALVAHTVARGWAGIEALSGIPGSVGAAPIQNIGAYGQEAADSLVSVDFLDFESGRVQRLPAAELGLGYRTSVFKRGKRGVVLSATFDLVDASGVDAAAGVDAVSGAEAVSGADAAAGSAPALGQPVSYAQLATALGVALGDRVPLAEVRSAVLALRASKGMVLDPADPDSVSAGSFFTNPIVTENFARGLPADAPRWLLEEEAPPVVIPLPIEGLAHLDLAGELPVASIAEPLVKLSAAWLIEQSGIRRGFSLPGSGAAISSKHTLAIVNTGSGTAADVAELARFVQQRVSAEFGLVLAQEPVFVGHDL
jgi:UDP-N-acetylmuramate dehydrogenase